MSAFDHYEAKDGDAMTDGLWTVRLTPNGRCHAVGGDSGDYQLETKTRCGRDYCSNRVEAHYYETEDQWRNESRMCHTCGDILAGVNGFSAELEVAP